MQEGNANRRYLTREAIQLRYRNRKFLYNSKGLDVISLLIKYYVPLAHINKELLKFKSAMQCFYDISQ